MAYIPLKDDAVPYRSLPFFIHGERGEAYKKFVMEECIQNGFVKKLLNGPGEWVVNVFVMAKKGDGFTWRGVVDLWGPNAQTKRCAYPTKI